MSRNHPFVARGKDPVLGNSTLTNWNGGGELLKKRDLGKQEERVLLQNVRGRNNRRHRIRNKFGEYDFSSRNVQTGYCETSDLVRVPAQNRWDTQMG